MASLVTTSRMQQCFNVLIDIYHEFLLLFYCCVLLEIKLTTTMLLLVHSIVPPFTHISISFIPIHSSIHSFFHPDSQWWARQLRLNCGNRGPIIRRSHAHLIFMMGIPIPGKTPFILN